jgi:hypothetical protein
MHATTISLVIGVGRVERQNHVPRDDYPPANFSNGRNFVEYSLFHGRSSDWSL